MTRATAIHWRNGEFQSDPIWTDSAYRVLSEYCSVCVSNVGLQLSKQQNRTRTNFSTAECTKIAHRRSLAIFAADSGIAGNSAVGIKFVPFNRRENRRSLAIFFAEQIAPLGASKIARFCGGAV